MIETLSKEEFIQKANKIHSNKYNYDKIIYKNMKEKIIITCNTHGDFLQIPGNHLYRKSGCPKCKIEKTINTHKYIIDDFIVKGKQVHCDNYDYSKVIYKDSKTKVIIVCPTHGAFKQTPQNHLFGQGCPKCRYVENIKKFSDTKEQFIEKARLIHGDLYDYSSSDYKNSKIKVCITCKKHGDFYQVPSDHLSYHGCHICKASTGEAIIKNILNKNNINSEPQYRIPDEKYLLYYDFYLPKLNILIEYHGIQHYKWIPYFQKTYHDFEKQQMRDKNKITLAKEKGIPLLEFNYKQLKELTTDQFKDFVLNRILERKINE